MNNTVPQTKPSVNHGSENPQESKSQGNYSCSSRPNINTSIIARMNLIQDKGRYEPTMDVEVKGEKMVVTIQRLDGAMLQRFHSYVDGDRRRVLINEARHAFLEVDDPGKTPIVRTGTKYDAVALHIFQTRERNPARVLCPACGITEIWATDTCCTECGELMMEQRERNGMAITAPCAPSAQTPYVPPAYNDPFEDMLDPFEEGTIH